MRTSKNFKLKRASVLVMAAVAVLATSQARAGAGWADNVDKAGTPFKQPTYFANSPAGVLPGHGPLGSAAPEGSTRDSGTAMRKFVDALPLVDGYVTNANLLAANKSAIGRHIPTAVKEDLTSTAGTALLALNPNAHSISFPDADYYEIAVVEYREQLHSDLPPVVKTASTVAGQGPVVTGGTTLRGFVQIWTPNLPSTVTKTQLFYLNGNPILDNKGQPVFAVGDGPHYLGPIIDSQAGTPVRLRFDNYLPVGHYDPITKTRGGDVFIPTDVTVPGSGLGPLGAKDPANPTAADYYTQNRALIHLHGGDTPWISDGEPHSWITPAGETTPYPRGETTQNVPDMPDPGPGAQTYYYPNNQSSRMMWYHDHSYGATRINVYAGIVSAFMLHDATEAAMKAPGGALAGMDEIPLIFEDKTFVPKDVATQDAKWSTDGWGQYGDLWFPHVYETNQNPNSIDGTNPSGRWDYGPWFWPVFPAPLALPDGSFGHASGVQEAFSDTPVINGVAYPNLNVEPKPYRFRLLNASGQRYLNVGFYVAEPVSVAVANPGNNYSGSTTATIDADANGVVPAVALQISPIGAPTVTMLQNGASYSAGTTVVFSGGGAVTQATGHAIIDSATGAIAGVVIDTPGSGYTSAPSISFKDPNLTHTVASATTVNNLATASVSLNPGGQILGITVTPPAGKTLSYTTVPNVNVTDPTAQGTGVAFAVSINTEVPMVPAVQPAVNPAYAVNTYDGRPGGIPDPASIGPNIIHIGTEGGFLAQPNVIPSTPVSYQQLRRIVTVLNVLDHGLYVGPAERADFVVDFSQFAGKTLIMYNDCPAPNPGFDARVDYYTGDVDQTATGGADTTLPGYGPNTRTIMRVQVAATQAGGLAPAAAYDPLGTGGPLATALPAAFAAASDKPVVPESWQNAAYGAQYTDNLARIYAGTTQSPTFNFNTGGVAQTLSGFTVDSAGAAYTVAPTVTLVGGLDPSVATAVAGTAHAVLDVAGARVSSIVLDTAGGPYINAPTVVLTGGNGIGAAATAVTSKTQMVHVDNKGIQELFEPNYGRMNATFSAELPFTSVLTQTTIPLAYIDPPTESIADGQVSFWKITHNGVDTHTVHFHLFNVQVINRVGWDGTVVALDPAEYGWKETVKMNPLEDIYVAVKPKSPKPPFGVPQSIRAYDPTQPLGATAGFTQVDPTTGLATTVQNALHNFDWEYVWHCHILGHEENDFMRPMSFNFGTLAPATVTNVVLTGNTVTWTDPTPAGDAATPGNKQNEIGFLIQRSEDGGATWLSKVAAGAWDPTSTTLPATIPQSAAQATQNPAGALANVVAANVTSWTDPVAPLTGTSYRVVGFNSAGYSAGSNVAGTPGAVSSLTASVGAFNLAVPGFPVTLTWSSPTKPSTNFTIVRSGGFTANGTAAADVTFTAAPTATTFTDTTADQISTYTYKITGVSGATVSPVTSVVVNTTFAPPPQVNNLSGTGNAINANIALSWAAPASTTYVTAYNVTRSGGGGTSLFTIQQQINPLSGTITAPATTYVDTTAAANTTYVYTVVAVNGSVVGTPSPTGSVTIASSFVPAPPAMGTVSASASSPTSVTVSWPTPAAGTYETGVQVSRTTGGVSAPLVVPAGAITSFVDTTAAQNTSYTYTVNWVNGAVAGTASTSAAVTTPYAPALPVLNAAATTNAARTAITLTWTANGATTGYTVARCTPTLLNANCTAAGSVFSAPVAVATPTYTDATVVAGSAYTYAIVAQNGTATASTPVVVQAAAVLPPAAPTLNAAVIANGSIALTWRAGAAVAGTTSAATGYVVQRSADGGLTWTSLATITAAATVTYTDFGPLTLGTTYQYRVYGTEVVGTATLLSAAPSATQAAGYLVPNAPTMGATTFTAPARAGGVTAVNINWTEVANAGPAVTSFQVYRDGVLLATTAAATRTYADTTYTAGTSPVYSVLAVNILGASTVSTVQPALLTQTVPTLATAVFTNATTATLSWTEVPNAAAPAVTAFQVWASVNGAAATLQTTTPATLTPTTLTATVRMTVGSTYAFSVRAVNAIGTSASSNTITVADTVPAANAAPTFGSSVRNAPVATSTTDTVVINWTPAAQLAGAQPVTSYVVQYANNATFTNGLVSQTVTVPAGTTLTAAQTATFAAVRRRTAGGGATGAPNQTTYYRVNAVNAVGTANGTALVLAPTSLK